MFEYLPVSLQGDAGIPGHPGPKGEPGQSISAPEVIVSPASLTVTQNQTATFYCSVSGNPKPSVSWGRINDTGLVNMNGHNNKLQIRNIGYYDTGSYVCMAANILGRDQKIVKLFVEGKRIQFINVSNSVYQCTKINIYHF